MKKEFILKALVIIVPVVVGAFAHHFENKREERLAEAYKDAAQTVVVDQHFETSH
jgi:uncharacterized membrane protein YgdD (TMEM256/DUF423 family)